MFIIVFQAYDFFKTINPYYFIPISLHLFFASILQFLEIFDFCHFSRHRFRRWRIILGTYSWPRNEICRNQIFLLMCVLENYVFWKRMLKYISKIHFSDLFFQFLSYWNLRPPVNCQPSHWREGSYSDSWK